MTSATYRAAAVAAGLSAITTFLLWLLPRLYSAPESLADAVMLHQNHAYLGRLWVNFVHVFLALAAYAAAATLFWRRSPGLAGFGFICFVLWGFVELVGVTINLFAVNFTWRAAYASSAPEVQQQLEVFLTWFPAFWDALFFLLLVGFLVGTLCFGAAAISGPGLEFWLGVLFLLAAPLTVAIMLGGYTRFHQLDELTAWIYPLLQPLSRSLLAVWLWKAGTNNSVEAASLPPLGQGRA